jgi:hypothetical protein
LKIHLNAGSAAISRAIQNAGFRCERCGTVVVPVTNGSYRNHCPACLWSKHVDVRPGDRAGACRGPMRPVGLDQRRGKGMDSPEDPLRTRGESVRVVGVT